MERLQAANEPEMITLYSLDGDHLMMTHYCSAGNQPQMKTATITELNGALTFQAYQITGLKSRDDAHMTGLTLKMPDRSEEHTSELQSPCNLVCRLLLEKKKKTEQHVYANI